MAEPKTPPKISEYCRDLSSKKASFLSAPPRSEEDILDGSGAVWCERTMQPVGPDGELVYPEHCQRGRSCYRSYAPEA